MKLTIPCHQLPNFHKRVKEIIRRSDKLGLGEVALTSLGETIIKYYPTVDGQLSEIAHAMLGEEFELTGPNLDKPLSLSGYEFVGKIDHTHSEYMWKAYGNAELPAYIQSQVADGNTSYCEHCNTNRRRNNTFVLRNTETDNIVWVGSTCLKDFIGFKSPDSLVTQYQSIESLFRFEDIDEDSRTGGINIFKECMDLAKLLPRVRNISKSYGFVTSKESTDILRPTSEDAFSAYWRTDRRKWDPVTGDDCEFADAAVEYWLGLEPKDEFTRNMQILCRDMWCRYNERGLAAWIIGGYAMHLGRAKKAERPESQYFGEEGQKVNGLELEMTVDRVWEYTDYYGYEETISFCYLMYTDDGIAFKMNSGKVLELGERITVTSGSIKEHKLYEGADEKQNILARPRFKVLTPDEA